MSQKDMKISGNIVDVVSGRIFRGTVEIGGGKIIDVSEDSRIEEDVYILPGLVDSHIHIESSMLVPSEFARIAVVHGTVATVSDPHEIANVLGIKGVEYMISNGGKVPFRFYFGASPCVPATSFETSGAVLGIDELDKLLQRDDIKYMSEMMNYPGVIYDDPEVRTKLELARKYGKPVDGHAPGLRGPDAKKYAEAGITTDHECFTLEEALEKIGYGMNILIREGSAAKNFEALSSLLESHPDRVMLCSDDRHPDDLIKGHLNGIVRRALEKGYDPISVFRSCTLNPARHYDLDTGLLRKGDNADLIVVDSLEDFNVLKTYIGGQLVADNGTSLIERVRVEPVNRFMAQEISAGDLNIPAKSGPIRAIGAIDGQLVTESLEEKTTIREGSFVPDISRDLLKVVVMNRYRPVPPARAFIKGFGLNRGAIASTVAHDSHNIIAVGTNDNDLAAAINLLVRHRGGIVAVDRDRSLLLQLPVGGIMSDGDGHEVARKYEEIDRMARDLGSALQAPFMTLSFMALLVIPSLKLSDQGLFDGKNFRFTTLELV